MFTHWSNTIFHTSPLRGYPLGLTPYGGYCVLLTHFSYCTNMMLQSKFVKTYTTAIDGLSWPLRTVITCLLIN